MPYRLRDGLSFCELGGRYIFLDITADRYFLLKAQDNAALASLLKDPVQIVPLSTLGPISALLSGDGDGAPLAATRIHQASQSLIEKPDRSVPSQYPSILLALAQARRDMRCKPLSQLIGADPFPAPSEKQNDAWLGRLAASFERITSGLGREGNCLPRSLALWRYLRRRGHDAQIVFGVKDLPFAAHCWVQSGTFVLNDRLETIQPFTPVLAR